MSFEGSSLPIKRAKEYIGIDPALGPALGSYMGESPNKLFVGGIPAHLNEEQVMELLKAFGELRTFNLVRDAGKAGQPGRPAFAFAEYLDPGVTDMAIQGLHNFQLGDRTLVVQRAATGRNTGVISAIPGSATYLSQARTSPSLALPCLP